MPVFQTTRRVAVPPDVAFAVAADVGSYREFLPLLQRSTVRGQKRPTSTGEAFDAELAMLRKADAGDRLRQAFGAPLALKRKVIAGRSF